jgi:hypothetical protein
MSDENQELDSGDDSGKGLRSQLEAALKRLEKAEAANAQLSKSVSERQLADVLSAKKVNPKVARFILADGVDPSDSEAVDKWVTDNAEVFGVKAEAPEPNVSQADQAAFAQMQSQDFTSPNFQTKAQAVIAKAEELIAKGADVKEIDKLFAESGI